MTDAEISGYMGWRGPGAYTQKALNRIRKIVDEVVRREREECANVCESSNAEHWSQCAEAIRARKESTIQALKTTP